MLSQIYLKHKRVDLALVLDLVLDLVLAPNLAAEANLVDLVLGPVLNLAQVPNSAVEANLAQVHLAGQASPSQASLVALVALVLTVVGQVQVRLALVLNPLANQVFPRKLEPQKENVVGDSM